MIFGFLIEEHEYLDMFMLVALWDMGKWVHEIRKKWGIASYCSCTRSQNEPETKPQTVNGLCKV